MKPTRLGRVQLAIMQVLWDRKRATAREITDDLNQDQPIAHSTVQTLLRKLEAKGSIKHEQKDRTFWFMPLVKPDSVRSNATRDLVDRVFGGSVTGLVAHLLRNETISPAELAEIRALIQESEKTHKERRS